MTDISQKKPIFLLTAQISAHLHVATKVAKRISLTAKNARAVTVRAGAQAAGFRAITDFLEELATSTIRSAEQINRIAVEISRMASDEARNRQALQYFERAEAKAHAAAYIHSIAPAREFSAELNQHYRESFRKKINRLSSHLEDSVRQVRSSNIISSTSKIEAALLGGFRSEFQVIAQDIEKAAQEIQQQLKEAQDLLDLTIRQYQQQ